MNLTPKEIAPWKISHICHCAFNDFYLQEICPYVFLSQRLANEVRVIICCEVLKSIHYLLEKKNEKIGSESKPFS